VVGAGRYEDRHEPVGHLRGPAAAEEPRQAVVLLAVALMDTPSPLIEYQAEIPDPLAFVRLFGTTSWDPEGRLTVPAAAAALAPTWYAVSAYEGERLVGTGRIIGDGVLHALLVDVIVDPD